MTKVTYSMGMSLDGYIMGPDGSFDWSVPDEALFRFSIEEVRRVGTMILGRRLYETMLYWEDPDAEATFDEAEREFADIWNALPKIVFSTTLAEVRGNARLATGSLAEEIERCRVASTGGAIAVGGAMLAAEAIAADLIDEYQIRVFPVLVGGGTSFFAHHGDRSDLELIETRAFDSQVVYLGYRVVHRT